MKCNQPSLGQEGPVVMPESRWKKWIYILNAMVFVIALAYWAALSLLLPRPTRSEVERRDLAAAPTFSLESYYGRKFTGDFDNFYADTFPGREGFIKASYAVNRLKGISGEVKLYKANLQEEQQPMPTPAAPTPSPSPVLPAGESPAAPTPSPTPTPPPVEPEVPDNGAAGYMSNNIFIYNNAAYQMFYGEHAAAASYAKIVSSYAAELPGVRVFTQVIPQPYNFYLPQKYKKMGKDEQEYATYLHSQLTDGAMGIKAYEKLAERKEEYNYFRTDTHWTGRGAYCAYLAYCEAAGLTPVPLERMETRRVPGDFLGYLYTLTMDSNLAATPDYVEYFIVPGVQRVQAILDRAGAQRLTTLPSLWAEDRRGGSSYSVFIYGDLPYMQVTTSAGTGKKVLLIKDSYGDAFAPFLVSHYDTVYILDERYYPYSVYDLIRREGIDDVIISNSSYSANSGSHQQNLITLKQGRNGPPPDYAALEAAEAEQREAEAAAEAAKPKPEPTPAAEAVPPLEPAQ